MDPAFDGLQDEIIHWLGGSVKIPKINLGEFPDTWPNIFMENIPDDIEYRDVTAVLDFSKPQHLLRNVALAQSIIDNTANKLRLIIPFFSVGTMERAKKRGEVTTAKPLAKMLSGIGSGREGKTSIHMFDIHDVRIKDFFGGDVNVEFHTGMHLVDLAGYDAVAFPDKGAADRFGEYYKGMYQIICDKTRVDGQEEKTIVIKEGDSKGKRVLLVGDLIQTGGTNIGTAKVLDDEGAESVSAWSTHGAFPNDSHKKFSGKVERLIVSNSVPENTQRAKDTKGMSVESIAPLITRIISKG